MLDNYLKVDFEAKPGIEFCMAENTGTKQPVKISGNGITNMQERPYISPLDASYQQKLQYDIMHQAVLYGKEQSKIATQAVVRENESHMKHKLAQEILDYKEKLRTKRELISYSVFEDADGYLYKRVIDADGKTTGCKRIINVKHMQLVKFVSKESEPVFMLSCDHDLKQINIVLEESQLNSKKLISAMSRHGICLSTSREYRDYTADLLIAHLMKYMKTVEITTTVGWNLCEGRWKFVEPGTLTMMEVKSHVRK